MKIKLLGFAFSLLVVPFFSLTAFTDVNETTGNAITVWGEYNNAFEILAVTQIGGVYAPSINLANPLTDSRDPVVSINSSNQAVSVWIGRDPALGTMNLYAASYQAGLWSPSVLISVPLLESVQRDYSVKVANNGVVVITWKSYHLTTGIFVMRSMYTSVFGTWTLPVTL
ncbi:MAG TPA: hypothetical protein PLC42_05380 [Parachlamydiaceae bacterium]|nr:hypothetical protein [Parachlamydiaceae bacterium]